MRKAAILKHFIRALVTAALKAHTCKGVTALHHGMQPYLEL